MKKKSGKQRKNGNGKRWTVRILFAAGFLLLCSPLAGNIVWRQQQKQAVASCRKSLEDRDESEKKTMIREAEEYNRALYQSRGAASAGGNADLLTGESYSRLLDVSQGIMGSLEIPKIAVDLPIYHGTADDVLSAGAGHQQGTSLPVGGENTHCALTGHRGLPGASLFTRLDELKKGDLFFLKVMDTTLAYRICGIQVVTPDNTGVLAIEDGRDLCSLITCTPYGINTHRMVVTGERIPYEETVYERIRPAVPSWREIILAALPFLLLASAAAFRIRDWRKEKNVRKEKENEKTVSGAAAVRDYAAFPSARIGSRRQRYRRRKQGHRRSGRYARENYRASH